MAAPMKKSMSDKKRKLENLSMDEFMRGGFESSSSESDKIVKKSKSSRKKKENRTNKASKTQNAGKSSKKTDGVVSKHKASLEKLKDQDPEFYEFLKDEDESLLKFGEISGSDVSDMSDDDDDDTSKSSEPATADIKNSDDDDDDVEEEEDDDDSEEEFPVSSDEEISTAKITKFLEKKNKEEIEKKKKALEETKTKVPVDQKEGNDKIQSKTKEMATSEKKRDRDSKLIGDKKQKKLEKVKASSKKDNKEGKASQENKQREKSSDDDDDDDDDSGDAGSDEDDIADEFDMDASDDSEEEMLHKPPEELEVMSESDEDDEEDEDAGNKEAEAGKKSGGKILVTMVMVKEWTKRFKEKPSPALIHEAVYAFKAAVQHTAVNAVPTKYKVEGSKVYNAVVRMCLVEIPGALQSVLELPKTTDLQKPVLPSSKNQKWKKVRLDMKSYLADVLKLLSDLSEANMINVLLKHTHKLVAYIASFPKLTKAVLKKCVGIWSTGEETSRVLAFLCINRLIRINQEQHIENCIKQMYMAYVRNCKFTSPNTLPMVNFMQRSFVEIMALDFSLAYQYAFIYIRQLAIHLRNAITTKKKESCQAVYNWQYIHCVTLWSRVLSATYPNEVLEPLIYPLVQTIIGTIKLIPTQRYYPLRFHCVRALTQISRSTQTFIPILPFLLEVLEQTDFNKKHKSMSFKPVNFACILKFTKTQLLEKSFKDGVIDQLYELLLEHFHAHAHSIGFPELALPALIQLKDFLKKCKVGNFTKQIKQIVDKVDENSKFITARRRSANISLADAKAVAHWESSCLEAGTPIGKFYTTWRKLRDRELMHLAASDGEVIDPDLPVIKRPQKTVEKATNADKKEFSALFDSDSDDDQDLTERFLPPEQKRQLRLEKSKQAKDKNSPGKKETRDDDEDFDSDELELLNRSCSEDDDSDVEYDDGKDDEEEDDHEEDEDDEDEDNDDDDDDDSDDVAEGEDIVKDFTMSSDEDDI